MAQAIQVATLPLSLLFITPLAVVEAIQIVLLVHLAVQVVVAQEIAVQAVLEQLGKVIRAAQVREHTGVAVAELVPLVLRGVLLEAKAVLARQTA